MELDQLAHRGLFTDLPYPDGSGRTLRVTGNGVLFDGEPLRPESPPPLLGQHNGERALLADQWAYRREGVVTSVEDVAQLVGDIGIPDGAGRGRAARPPGSGADRVGQPARGDLAADPGLTAGSRPGRAA